MGIYWDVMRYNINHSGKPRGEFGCCDAWMAEQSNGSKGGWGYVFVFFLSLSLSIYLSVYKPIYMSVYLSKIICLPLYIYILISLLISIDHYLSLFIYIPISISISGYLPTYLPTYLGIYLPTCLSIYLSTYLPAYLSIYLSIYLSLSLFPYLSLPISPFLSLSIYLSIYLSVCLSIDLSVCLSIYRSVYLFNSSTCKSVLKKVCFLRLDFEMWFSLQWRALFWHLNFQKWSCLKGCPQTPMMTMPLCCETSLALFKELEKSIHEHRKGAPTCTYQLIYWNRTNDMFRIVLNTSFRPRWSNIEVLKGTSSIDMGVAIAMFDSRRVIGNWYGSNPKLRKPHRFRLLPPPTRPISLKGNALQESAMSQDINRTTIHGQV